MKKILIIFLLFFIFPFKVFAADYQVTCDNTGCTGSTAACFYEDNLAPGDKITKTIEINSVYDQTLNLDLSSNKLTNTDEDLLKEITITIIGLEGRIRFSNTLEKFFTPTIVDLGSLTAHKTKSISLTVSLNQFDNQYQTNKAWFDIPINITVQSPGRSQSSKTKSKTQTLPQSLSALTSAWLFNSQLGQVAGLATPSAQATSSAQTLIPISSIFNQLKTYFRWWPWLFLLVPILWLIFLLFIKPRRR